MDRSSPPTIPAHILGAGNIGRIIAVPHNGYIEPAGDAAHILCAVHRAHIGTGDDVCLTIGVVAGAIGEPTIPPTWSPVPVISA